MLPFVPPVKKQVLAIRRYAWPDFFFCRINACSQVNRHGPGAIFLQGAHVKIGAAEAAFFQDENTINDSSAAMQGSPASSALTAPVSISTLG
jgi:hypothetical protein